MVCSQGEGGFSQARPRRPGPNRGPAGPAGPPPHAHWSPVSRAPGLSLPGAPPNPAKPFPSGLPSCVDATPGQGISDEVGEGPAAVTRGFHRGATEPAAHARSRSVARIAAGNLGIQNRKSPRVLNRGASGGGALAGAAGAAGLRALRQRWPPGSSRRGSPAEDGRSAHGEVPGADWRDTLGRRWLPASRPGLKNSKAWSRNLKKTPGPWELLAHPTLLQPVIYCQPLL